MTRNTSTRRRARQSIAVLTLAIVAAVLAPSLATSQTSDFVNGSGKAFAQVIRVGPTAGRLSLAPTIGLSLADYVTTVGRGEVLAAEWAAVGIAEPALPDNTPRLKVETGDEGAAEGIHEFVAGQSSDGTGGGLIELFGRATDAPFGESRFSGGRFSIPGLIETSGGVAHTTSGIVAEGVRRSTAVVEIGNVDIGGGAVRLEGLRWEAIQTSGDDGTETAGSFSLGSAVLGGELLPVPIATEDVDAAVDVINTALGEIGLSINRPRVAHTDDLARMTPLSIDIADSPAGRAFIAPLLEAAQPVREPLSQAFIDFAKQLVEASDGELTDLSVGVLAADVAIGILAGSSQLHIELGGVSAITEGERFNNPLLGAPQRPPVVGGGVEEVFIPGTEGTPGSPATPATPVDDGDDTAELVVSAPQPGPNVIPGSRGGAAVAVGLIGLGIVLALGAADWIRMRRKAVVDGTA